MQGHIEAIIRNDRFTPSADICNVSGIIGERFIKLFPAEVNDSQPYIVPGVKYKEQADRFIGISFTCHTSGFIAWFASGFNEVRLTKKDKIHIYFEGGNMMSLNMMFGRHNVSGYPNGNIASLTPVQMAFFCNNCIDCIVAESGTTGVKVKVRFVPAENNMQYNNSALGVSMVKQAARTITVTQQNLMRLS